MYLPSRYVSAAVIASLVLLAGCQSAPQPSPMAAQEYERCNSAATQHLVGQTATAKILEQARLQSGASKARILRPDDVVTLEYDSRRLNINTNADMRIERIGCG
ncbi:peptidase inhibitor I78 family protein [Pseudomonas stutzeri]|uniref:I78 family peptidase inhibitor n=1 Tax=Stutzerimonas stutzeri TaxID=316 RepID=UPI00190C3174|nr:peptidase inhibitor I78 family protein [Stutzerimonas stutzeri]